ncbi:MAG TPA: sulfotransferase [Baekduia sp.]|nr:sulfotransferase [Baekduia sp.]
MVKATNTTGPPDFIGVGAQRSGTTWWFRTLSGHPEIRPAHGRRRAKQKELHFFDRFGARELTDADIAEYHALFPRKPGQIAGECTPRYMRDVWVAPLLRRAAPDAKLIVMLRDPVERYRSGVQHQLTRTPQRLPERLASDAVERGRYALQLERLQAFFPPERILVLQYEQCRQDAPGQFRRTLRFLGVDEGYDPADLHQARGTTTEAKKDVLWQDLYRALQGALEPQVQQLAALVPDLDLALWPNFAHLATGGAPPREDPRAHRQSPAPTSRA